MLNPAMVLLDSMFFWVANFNDDDFMVPKCNISLR